MNQGVTHVAKKYVPPPSTHVVPSPFNTCCSTFKTKTYFNHVHGDMATTLGIGDAMGCTSITITSLSY